MINKYIAKAGSTALATLILTTGLIAPAQAATTPSPNAINTYSRAAVASAYANKWIPATNSPISWTGDAASCNAGTESADSLAKGAQALNFYRGLAGLDSINLSASQNTTAQTTALMMEANGMINHYPDASWKCYTQLGAQGAATSNLFGGGGSYQINSASTPIKAYMDDYGVNNAPVGHRRWILNPSTATMGMGTTKGFNALNVVGAPTDANRTSPTMIGFPGSGYFPQQLEPNGRWSVSSAQGVDFSGATVNVKDANGTALSVTPLSTAEGYGPNTLSFQVQGLTYASGNGEAKYTVTVDNMKKNNLPFSYNYTVRLFDGTVSTSSVVPADPMPTLPTPVVTVVPVAPTFGATNYAIPTTTGVVYKVNGVVTPVGIYNASTPITITATAASGYTLTGAATWSKDFTPVVVQPIAVTPTAPTFGATTYTIPYQAGVDYKVNGGSTLQGTYTAAAPVTVTAVALSGYTLSGTTTWSKDYTPGSTQTPVTAVAPTLGATSYTIPTVTGINYMVNGAVKPAGTYSANNNVTITAAAKAGYVLSGTASWSKDYTPAPVANPSIKSVENFITADPAGDLWDYGDFTGARRLIDYGWAGYTNLNVVDWDKDGIADIIAKSPSGTLYVYKGLSAGGFSRMSLGDGWGPYDVYVGSWIKGSKYPSVIARNNNTGELFHYANESGTTFSKRVFFDYGWNGYGIHITDWDKDGNADIVAKSPAGQMLVYRTDGNNSLIRENRQVIGLWGWSDFSTKTIKNFRGSNTDGIIARHNNGALYYYQMNPSGLAKPINLGLWGWNDYNIANK